MNDKVTEIPTCGICGKPVHVVRRFNKPPAWEHQLRDTPVPWHNPAPRQG